MLRGRPVVGRDVFEQFLVVGVCVWERAGIETRSFCALRTHFVDTFLLSELSARDRAKRAICGHGEATVVVALELLGGDFAIKVEDVAKDVKKLHAMQAIMK